MIEPSTPMAFGACRKHRRLAARCVWALAVLAVLAACPPAAGADWFDSDSSVWTSRATRGPDDFAPREELQVSSIIKDNNFDYGAGVRKWYSLVVGATTCLVGVGSSNNVTILKAKFVAPDFGSGQTYSLFHQNVDLGFSPSAAALFKNWNQVSKELEAVLVLYDEREGSLKWYKITDSGMQIIGSWKVNKKITSLQAFQAKEQMKLLMLTSCATTLELVPCNASADVIDFTVSSSIDAKLTQSLPLEAEAASAEIGVVGDNIYIVLALPDANRAKLFHYYWPLLKDDDYTVCGYLKFVQDFESPRVAHAVFFHVSFKMYLAIGGGTPTLFRFVGPSIIEGCRKALQNVGFVSRWLALPIHTYRNEVVLLAEVERVIASTQFKGILTLTWASAGIFKWQTQPPCYIGTKEVAGESCIVGENGESGLNGAVAVQLGDASVVTVIVPMEAQSSALFRIFSKLQPVVNPLLAEIQILIEAQKKLQFDIDKQEIEMEETEKMLKDTLNSNGPNIVKADWTLSEVISEDSSAILPLPAPDKGIDIANLKAALEKLHTSTKSLQDHLQDAAVPRNGEVQLSGRQTLLGGLDVSGSLSFDSLSASSFNGESIATLLKDAVRKDNLKKIAGTKIMVNLNVQNLSFSTINSIPKDDLVFNVPEQSVRVHGNLEITQLLHVHGNIDLAPTGTVGDIDLSEQIFLPGKDSKGSVRFDEVTVEGDLSVNIINKMTINPSTLKSIQSGTHSGGQSEAYDTLSVGGHLQAERINGFLWSDLARRIVWRDSPAHIPGVTVVSGTLKSGSINMKELNGLDFPYDYVLRSQDSQHVIGKKTIQNQLLLNSLNVSDKVDGVKVDDLVTLTTDQNLNGELKLTQAHIVSDMKVDWAVNGIRLDQMHPTSPLIGGGEIVSSNVELSHIVVDGSIQISNTLNNRNFKQNILNILVLPALNETVKIAGKKTVLGNVKVGGVGITIESDIINGRKISSIANTESIMIFQGMKKIQNVVFDNITLTGLWDTVNVGELNAEAIRLTGNQETSARLTIVDPLPSQNSKMYASRLVIADQINTHIAGSILDPLKTKACDEVGPGGECVIKRSINASIVRVGGDVSINGKVCGWRLDDFENRRMSRSRPQNINGHLTFGDVTVSSHMQIDNINGKPLADIPDVRPPSFLDLQKLKLGNFSVHEMIIYGNIYTTGGVNDMNITSIANKAVKLRGANIFEKPLVFKDALNFASLQVQNTVCSYDLASKFAEAVLKNESANISGRITFMDGFDVEGSILTRNLNGLDPLKIITKDSSGTVSGPLRVQGNVYAGNVNLTGLLNNVPIQKYQNRHKLVSEGRHILYGNAHFLSGASVKELSIMHSVQEENLEKFFRSVVMVNESARITGTKIFYNKARFQNVKVTTLVNTFDLSSIAADMVLIDDENPVTINGHISFGKSLTARVGVSLSENLDASMLDGCLINEWLTNAVYLSKPMQVSGLKTFSSMSSSSDLKLSYINAVDLEKVVTLHTQQDIKYKVNTLSAYFLHDLDVRGLVNGKHLQKEFKNTLMTKGDQDVFGFKTFLNGVTVRKNVLVDGLISNKNITNVVTLLNDEIIHGPLKFSNLVLNGDLSVSGHISGIDVKQWEQRAFLTSSPQQQTVTGTWDVKGEVKYMDSVGVDGLLDGESVLELSQALYQSRERTRKTQEQVKAEWVQLCHDTDALREKARAQPFLFQQLEVVQSLKSSQIISSMHAFEALNEQFLAVSFSNNCSGALYRWDGQKTRWNLLDGSVQNMGNVERWATVRDARSTYLVTSSVDLQNCPYKGGNVWRFEGSSNLTNMQTVGSWHDVQVDELTGQVHLLGRSGVQTWQLENGAISNKPLQLFPEADQSRFVPRSAGLGLSTSDGKKIRRWDNSAANLTSGSMSPSTNSNLPAWNEGNVVSMKIGDGRKLVAVTADASDLLVVYEDVASGHAFARVNVRGAHSLSVLELTGPGRTGQTLLAFIEDERQLRVVQYKGVEGFVDVTKSKLPFPVKEMVPVRLFTRGLVNQRHFLLLRSDYQVLLIEVEMVGDPLDDLPLQCVLP